MKIVGYTYCAAAHCPECAARDADVGILTRRPPLMRGTDQHGLAFDLIDREGNSIGALADYEIAGESCDDCGVLMGE